VGPKTAKLFAGLAVEKPRTCSYTLPFRAGSTARWARRSRARTLPGTITVEVTVGQHRRRRDAAPTGSRSTMRRPSFQLVFFHARDDYLRRILPTGARRVVSGKVELFDGLAQMVHPDHVLPANEAGRSRISSRSIR
jgi:ATP-dependent DNA helicase RecG